MDHTHKPFRMMSRPVIGWAMYDFANTIFSFAVLTKYFNEWITQEQHRPDWNIGVMMMIVGLVLVVIMPALGAVSDQIGRRLPFLVTATAVCIAATAALGFVQNVVVALVVAGVAIFAYQLSLSMYDPLLAVVAPEEHRAAVSGLGVGLGYVGVILGAGVLLLMVGEGDKQAAFLPTAAMFLVFSLPLILWVKEHPHARSPETDPDHDVQRATTHATPSARFDALAGLGRAIVHIVGIMLDALNQLVRTASHMRSEHREVGRFLIARFLYVDALATVIGFMTVYIDRLGGFSEARKTLVSILAMIFGAVGAVVAGRVVERVGPKLVLQSILLFTTAVLLVASLSGSAALVWVLGPAVGIALGSVWTSDRVLMMRLSPPAVRGEFFGLYNLVGKISDGIGPLVLWSGTIYLLNGRGTWTLLDASRAALFMLALAVIGGWLVLRPVSDHVRFADSEFVDA